MNTEAPITARLAFSYLRFSTPEQQRGDSFRRQKDLAERYAAKKGLQLDARSFQDLGISAFRGANAEMGKLGEFREAVEAGLIPAGSVLLVESLDRLSRDKTRRALRLLEDICDAGITVVTLIDEREYSKQSLDDDPMSLMWALMVGMRAHEESATKARRLKAVWGSKRAKASARPLTARAPAWLQLRPERDGFDVLPERGEVIRRIFGDYLAGVGPHLIAERLNREGVAPFGRGRYWHRSYIIKMLDSPAVIGTYVPHVVEYVEGRRKRIPRDAVERYYPAVIDPETFAGVREMRAGKRSPHSKTGATAKGISHVLAGLAKCPKCGGAMIRVNKGAGGKGGYPYLICSRAKVGAGCVYRSVRVEMAEATVLAAHNTLSASMPLGSPTLLDVEARFKAERDKHQREADKWLNAIAEGGPAGLLNEMLRKAEDGRDKAEAGLRDVRMRLRGFDSISRMARLTELGEALRQERTVEANALLRLLFKHVTVDWEHGRLTFAWQQGGTTSLPFEEPADDRASAA